MYLIYDNKPGHLGYCTDSKTYTTQLKLSDVLKAFSLSNVSDSAEFYKLIEYTTKYNLPLVYVYDKNLKEIPVTTFINDNPELFI